MSSTQVGVLLRHIRQLSAIRSEEQASDRQLLERFATRWDEAAFAALLQRHGRMVLGVCQSVLHNRHDAEDAFQAVFLVLARKAGSIHWRESVSGWLYRVAYHLAVRARASASRRRVHEQRAAAMPPADPVLDMSLRELRDVLNEELQRLPEAYRAPLVLCALEEKSLEEAARLLGWSKGAVKGRLQRGRERLRQRLRRRGLELSIGLLAAALSASSASAQVSATLTAGTLRAALRTAAGEQLTAGAVSANVAALVQGASKTMCFSKAKIVTVLFLAMSLAAAGIAWHRASAASQEGARQSEAAKPKAPQDRTPPAPPAKPAPKESLEVSGQVLDPEGKPFAGAKLYFSTRTLKGFEVKERGTSGKDGRFRLSIDKSELVRSGGEKSGEHPRLLAGARGHGPGWVALDGSGPFNGLTLRLVKDAPVGGRILDADGKPVAGAKLTVDGVSALTGAKPKGFVFVYKFPIVPYVSDNPDNPTGWAGPLPGQPAVLTTAADGRFRLAGIGRDRVVSLHLEGPGIATVDLGVTAGAAADHVAAASRPIRGVVRDKATGKPLAGATLFLYWRVNPRNEEPRWGQVVTDKKGHYELLGLAKVPNYNLIVKPARGQLYFQRNVQVQDTPGLDPLTADIDMVQGLTVRGKVTDKATGKPIAGATVDYHPLYPNPNVRKLAGSWRPRSEAATGPDGSYTLTVLPGPGVIGVVGPNPDAYRTACVTPKERKDFFKTPLIRNNSAGFLFPAVGGNSLGILTEHDYNALVLLEPREGDKEPVKDIALESPLERKGRVVDPDGQPIVGVTVNGLLPRGYIDETLKGSEFTVRGLNPKAKRALVFHHKGKNLGIHLKELPDEKLGPLTVKLQPCGSVSGRIVDQDGQPVAGVPTLEGVTTDKEGRFHVGGLVPGMEYHIMRPKVVATILVSVVAEAGKNKDLGDLKVDN